MNLFKCLQETAGLGQHIGLAGSLCVLNPLKLGLCGGCLSGRCADLSNGSCYQTKLDSSLDERKHREEDHFNQTVIQ